MENFANYQEIEAIKTYVHSWEHLAPEQIQFERLGGLSNQMWKVTSLDSSIEPKSVIFRKFGNSTLVDRKQENYILSGLADKGFAPKFYGGTDEYRIEKFYESTTLTPSKVYETETRRQLAKIIAQLHSVKFDDLDKTPAFLKVLDERTTIKNAQERAKRDVYAPLERQMLDEIFTLTSEEETAFLKKHLPKKPESVCFSHNDIHSQNILVLDNTNKLLVIDYEYSCYNYRGYDIANLFNESMFEYQSNEHPYYYVDESKFPGDDELHEFIRYYLLFFKFRVPSNQADAILKDADKINDFVMKKYNLDAFLEEVEEIFQEVKICRLISHYYWIFWAVNMSKNGDDFKFDYIHYAHKRFELYNQLKRQFFKRRLTLTKQRSQGV